MANICKNTLTVIGVQEAPETFVKTLSKSMFGIDLDNLDPKKWGEGENVDGNTWYSTLTDEYRREGVYAARYCILYPEEPYNRLGITAPRFYVETKWATPMEEVAKASKAFPELTFHVNWWRMQDGPVGEYVMKGGRVLESIERNGSWYLFDFPVLYPSISLLSAHMPHTLPQQAALRVEDATQIIDGLRGILDDSRFIGSPYQACRDRAKLGQTRQTIDGLLAQMKVAAKQLDFEGVFIDDSRRQEVLSAELAETEHLGKTLGLDFLVPSQSGPIRFAILPFAVATTNDPYRVIVPALRYTNADPATGKYTKNPGGSFPPIAWELGYVGLSSFNMKQIKNLPDEEQTPYDIDIVMRHSKGRAFGYEFNRISAKARWKQNPELVKEVEQEATEMSDVFAAKLAGKPGTAIFSEFQAVEAAQGESKSG